MDTLRQVGTGILLAVVSVILIIGGFSLAMVEGKSVTSIVPTATYVLVIPPGAPTLSLEQPTIASTPLPQDTPSATAPVDLILYTSTPNPLGTPTALLPIFASSTPIIYYPTVANCGNHTGYVAITVKLYDTVSSLALVYNMTPAALMQANCLTSEQLQVGSVLYVLPKPAPTYYVAPTTCGAPYGWVNYYVVSGDTLFNISLRYGVTVAQLQSANCMGSSYSIQAGQSLKVPYVIISTPKPTLTGAPTATTHPTITYPSSTPAASPTAQPTAVPPTLEPTNTAVPPTIAPTSIPATQLPTSTPFAGLSTPTP